MAREAKMRRRRKARRGEATAGRRCRRRQQRAVRVRAVWWSGGIQRGEHKDEERMKSGPHRSDREKRDKSAFQTIDWTRLSADRTR
jgi:hypothetical protein